jgi:hypothetical protein
LVRGVAKEGLLARPANRGRNCVYWRLTLPPENAKLTGFVGIRDTAKGRSNGVGFRIAINGEPRWGRDVSHEDEWVGFELPLAEYARRDVILLFVTDALGSFAHDAALWGEPRIVPIP